MILSVLDRPKDTENSTCILSGQSFFKDANRLEIEIGCGKGLFLAEEAKVHLRNYYLGIESARTYARIAEERMCERKIQNVRILHWKVEEILPYFLPQSASRFHIYFPDPWPKKRHHKRRIWTQEFMDQMRRILTPEGKIYFGTDYLEYFDAVMETLDLSNSLFALERKEQYRFFEDAATPTSYERKFKVEGRPLRFASFVKRVE